MMAIAMSNIVARVFVSSAYDRSISSLYQSWFQYQSTSSDNNTNDYYQGLPIVDFRKNRISLIKATIILLLPF